MITVKGSRFKTVLSDFLASHPSRSIPGLAKRAKVGEMTIRRIMQGETDASLETMMRILSVISSPGEQLDIIKVEFPEMEDIFNNIIKSKISLESESHDSSPSMNEYLKTFTGCKIINLAATRGGITREKIAILMGEDGTAELIKMLTAGILVENNGTIHTKEQNFSVSDISTAVAQVKHFAEMFGKNNVRLKGFNGGLFIYAETFNKEGIREIANGFNEYSIKISEIKDDSKYFGDIPFYVTSVMGPF